MGPPAKVDALLSLVYRDYWQFSSFLGVGIVATLVDWAIFYLLAGYLGIFYMLALALSYLASTVLNFFLNRHFTFENTCKKVHFQLGSFFSVAITGLVLNEVIVYSLIHYLFAANAGNLVMASRIIATVLVFIWNFILNKYITFRIFR